MNKKAALQATGIVAPFLAMVGACMLWPAGAGYVVVVGMTILMWVAMYSLLKF